MAVNKESLLTSKLLADIQWKLDLSELEKERYGKVKEMMEKMPGGKIRTQIQYLEKVFLPAVASKRGGESSPDYKFFQEVVKSLTWCLVLYDRLEREMRENTMIKLEKSILAERLILHEQALLQYTSLENIYLSEMLEVYDRGVREKIKGDLETKKR